MKTIKTLTLSVTLAGLFLSAGAFARPDLPHHNTITINTQKNLTVIEKNSHWPVKSFLTTEPCSHARCISA